MDKYRELQETIWRYRWGLHLYPARSLRTGIHYELVHGGLFPIPIPEEGTSRFLEDKIERLVRELSAINPKFNIEFGSN